MHYPVQVNGVKCDKKKAPGVTEPIHAIIKAYNWIFYNSLSWASDPTAHWNNSDQPKEVAPRFLLCFLQFLLPSDSLSLSFYLSSLSLSLCLQLYLRHTHKTQTVQGQRTRTFNSWGHKFARSLIQLGKMLAIRFWYIADSLTWLWLRLAVFFIGCFVENWRELGPLNSVAWWVVLPQRDIKGVLTQRNSYGYMIRLNWNFKAMSARIHYKSIQIWNRQVEFLYHHVCQLSKFSISCY